MFRSYMKSAWRHVIKHKLYSITNITGLGVGFAAAILIMFWVQHELSYDRFNTNHENIFRINERWPGGGTGPGSSYPIGPALKEKYPEVKNYLHATFWRNKLVRYNDINVYENQIFFAGAGFFRMFSYHLLSGDPGTALEPLNSIVISESYARKYFEDEDPVGKILNLDNLYDLTVTGVMEDIPDNSHLRFDMIGNIDFLFSNEWSKRWVDHQYLTYLELEKGTDWPVLGEKIKGFLYENNHDQTQIDILLQPLKDIHLGLNIGNVSSGIGRIMSVYPYLFSVIALIIILIACINYMNLSTAQSINRSKEIGVRKSLGAHKNQIAMQYLYESNLISLFALLLAMLLVYLLLPGFNQLTGKNLGFSLFTDTGLITLVLCAAIITGFISGSYPALFLSSFNAISILKGKTGAAFKSLNLRRTLVIIQFSLSIILLIGTFVVYNQITFMSNQNLGFDSENLLYVTLRGELDTKKEAFKQEILKNPNVSSASLTSGFPYYSMNGSTGVSWEGMTEKFKVHWGMYAVEPEFLNTFGFEFVEGPDIPEEVLSGNKLAYIVNESGAKILGAEPTMGKQFAYWERDGSVVGVVKDFHYRSLYSSIEPLAIMINPDWNAYSYVVVKFRSDAARGVVGYLEELCESFNPGYPFTYSFVDEEFANLYVNEERISRIIRYFSILAVIILCLGLLGLSSFIAEQRTREMGIRKVLGATDSNLLILLNREFFLWIIFANIIAWPIGWFVMNRWLENFAYKTSIDITVFIYSGILITVISLSMVILRTFKATRANPVDSLRYE